MPPTPPPVAEPTSINNGLLVAAALLLPLLLGALSVRWLHDWGLNGPAFARGMAAQQQQSLWLSAAAGMVVWLLRDRLVHGLLRALTHTAGWMLAARVLALLAAMLATVLLIGLLHWAHKLDKLPGLPGALVVPAGRFSAALIATGLLPIRPAVTLELLRLPVCALLAWCLYRWWHGRLPLRTQALAGAATLLALVLGLWASRDKGPMLVAAVAVVWLLAGLVSQRLRGRTVGGRLRALPPLATCATALGALLWLLPLLTPADRLQAWRTPFDARLEYLAEITWLLQAAGPQGFGAGQVPWCGHLGALQAAAGAPGCPGMPTETQSDFTFAALAALWGSAASVAVVALLALWLLVLLRLAARATAPRHGIDATALAAATGALYLLMLLAQLFITVLGNVGVLPLTGVPMPLLSWGRASLLGTAIAVALVLPRPAAPPVAAPDASTRVSLWHGAGMAAGFTALVALVAAAMGLAQRLQAPAPDRLAQGRSNPWLPLPGCIHAADGAALAVPGWLPLVQARLCGTPSTAGAVLPDDTGLRMALQQAAQRSPAAPPLVLGALRLPRRSDVRITLDGAWQQRADGLIACLTGVAGTSCPADLPATLRADAARRFEGAFARSVSIVTLRQADGAVLALAHGRSACSQAQMLNAPRPAHCPPEAALPLRRAGRAGHQALRADDMVASTVKPLLADALLHADDAPDWLHGTGRAQLLQALARSDSAFFIDQLLCFQPGGNPQRCHRPALLAQRAQALGLADPLPLVPGAPSLLLSGLPFVLPTWPPAGPRAAVDLAAAHRCHARQPADQRWRGCQGEQLAALLAPLWGQGGARSHPLAVARLYLQLMAAHGGRATAPAPHLLAGQPGPQRPAGFLPVHARLIVEGLQRSPLAGTAASACRSVRGPVGCNGLGLAVKTGTSLFPHHVLDVHQRARLCSAAFAGQAARRAAGRQPDAEQAAMVTRCALYPMKWAVLIEDSASDGAAITVVLVERNADATSGRLDDGDDRGPNPAVQAALLLHAPRLSAAGTEPRR